MLKHIYTYIMSRLWHRCFRLLLMFIYARPLPIDGNIGVTSLIGHKHVHMFICSLHSLFFHLNVTLPCFIVDDGTLTKNDLALIQKHFPNIHIERHDHASKKLRLLLHRYPHMYKYRQIKLVDQFNLKLTDPFLLCPFEKIIYMDCDVLFLHTPTHVQVWMHKKNSKPLYVPEREPHPLEPNEWQLVNNMFRDRFDRSIDPDFNSGFLCVRRSQYDMRLVDKVLEYIYRIQLERSWTPEQYALSAIWAQERATALPKSYATTVRPLKREELNAPDKIFIHFAYLAKSQYIRVALREIFKTNFFRQSSKD